MPKLSYFPLIMDRWVAGTREMSFEQKGFYIDLLVYLYDSGQPIKDAAHAARITGCDPRTSRRLLADLRQKFYRRSDGLRHKLVTEILKKGGKINNLGRLENETEQHLDQDQDQEEDPPLNSPPLKPKKSKPKPAPVDSAPEAPQVPDGLDLNAWNEYEAYRRETRRAKLKTKSVTRLMRWLVEQPDQGAVIEQTIRNGWTGLFELKANGENYDKPVRGSYDWYRARAKKRMESCQDAEVLGGDEADLWPALGSGVRRDN